MSAKSYVPTICQDGLAGPPIEYVREHGKILLTNGTRALVETTCGMTLFYTNCELDAAGKIERFAPHRVNMYARINPPPGYDRDV